MTTPANEWGPLPCAPDHIAGYALSARLDVRLVDEDGEYLTEPATSLDEIVSMRRAHPVAEWWISGHGPMRAGDMVDLGGGFGVVEVMAYEPPRGHGRTTVKAATTKPDPSNVLAFVRPAADHGDKLSPSDMARLVLRDHDLVCDALGNVYEYNGVHWRELEVRNRNAPELLSYAFAVDTHDHTSHRRRSETVAYILAHRQVGTIEWNRIAPTEVPLRNAVVDVVSRKGRVHRRDDWLDRVIPHEVDRRTVKPERWLGCLSDWFGEDAEFEAKCLALQEFFGYILLPHARYKKALILHGAPDCGKSGVISAIRHLVGPEHVCSISTDHMDDARALAPIKGMAVNLLGELPAKALIQDGGFKQLVSTGDPVQIDEKFKPPQVIVPTAKHVFACNNLPRIDDRTAATYNRLMVLDFPRSIPKEQMDRELDEKLRADMPGIVRWALEGARRLIEQKGQFTVVNQSDELLAQLRHENNPLAVFMDEATVAEDGAWLSMTALRKEFKSWSTDTRGISSVWFGRQMSAAGFKCVPRSGERVIYGRAWRRPS